MKPATEAALLALTKRDPAYEVALDTLRRGVWGASGYDRVLRLLADLRFPEDPESMRSTLDGQTRWMHPAERAAVELLRIGLGYPKAGLEPEPKGLEYVGDNLPRWVAQGVRVKVKSTPWTKTHGVTTLVRGNYHAYPGDIGIIERTEGNGWWDWRVVFNDKSGFRGSAEYRLDSRLLENLVRVKG